MCAYSPWSEPIDPKSADSTNVVQVTTKSGRSQNVSKLTILVIGLTCGLVFFALLSVILACVLRYRKRHLTERHILGSATQWDAQFCGDLMKSIHADETATTRAFHTGSRRSKLVKPFYKHTLPSAMFYSFSSSGLHSPTSSSMGLQMMHPMYPSAGGLASGALPGRSITSQSLRSAESPGGTSGIATDLLLANFGTIDLPVHSASDMLPKSPDSVRRTEVIPCDHINNKKESTAILADQSGCMDSTDIKTELGSTVQMHTSPSYSTDSNGCKNM